MVVKMEVHHVPGPADFDMVHPSDTLGLVSDWMLPLVPLAVDEEHEKQDGTKIKGDSDSKFCDYAELLIPGKAIAGTSIPQGAMSLPIEPWTLLGDVDIQQISVGVTLFGTLDLDNKYKSIWPHDYHWVRGIRLSNDCHTYNVQLKLQPSCRSYKNVRGGVQPKLILQVVRPIEMGQELQLWFSEDILAMLQVVFLKPSNIRGENKYKCLRCSALYESPNPLKLHITLACGKLPISSLWERLATLIGDPQSAPIASPKVKDFEFKLTPDTQTSKQRDALDLTISAQQLKSNVTTAHKALQKGHYSAFKPFKKHAIEINATNRAIALNPQGLNTHDLPPLWPMSFETDVVQLHRNLMQTQDFNNTQSIYGDDAQIESLVSSLGKAKQGHICLYCGKCYSRKYGLKIHIRTHTGYKPLRCKFCDRPFGDPSNLNKHVRLHAEGNTPYKCDLCGKILVRRRDLERHLTSRHMIEIHPDKNILPENSANNENLRATTDEVENSSSSADKSIFTEDYNSSSVDNIKITEKHPDVTVINEKCLDSGDGEKVS
ncbi:zinc finger protein 667 [Euwallacea similis]|uniref:zinc finger protein 667 n=1 Tax=Euwallacea similis TaxID=1736056 RepID=UPI00344ED108